MRCIQFLYGVPCPVQSPVSLVTVHVSRFDAIIPIMLSLLPYLIPVCPEAHRSNHDFQMRMAREPI